MKDGRGRGSMLERLMRRVWPEDAEYLLADLRESVAGRRTAGVPEWRTRLWLGSQLLRSIAHGIVSGGAGSRLAGRGRRLHPGLALRLALRGLRRDVPTSTAVVGILALGIAAPAVFFSLMWGGGMRPLPVPDGERIVRIEIVSPRTGGAIVPTVADLELLNSSPALAGLAGFEMGPVTLRVDGWGTVRFVGAALTSNSFDVLGVRPAVGRIPEPGEGGLLLGWEVWQETFDGDPELIGASAVVDGQPGAIVGVMPEGFGFPLSHSAWTIVDPSDRDAPLALFGRLASGADEVTAGSELTARWRRGDELRATESTGGVATVRGYTSGRGEAGEAFIFFGLVVVGVALLIIAAVNAANLLMVRAVERLDTLGVQAALGAARAQIALQLFAEALLLSAFGGAIGLVLTHLVVDHIQRTASQNFGYYWMRMEVELPVILFTVALVVGTAIVAGFVPIRRVLKTDLQSVLKRGAVGSAPREGWASRLLTSGQLALSCAALAAAGLASKAIGSASDFGQALPVDEVVFTMIDVPTSVFGSDDERRAVREELGRGLQEARSVGRVALAQGAPGFQEGFAVMEFPDLTLPEEARRATLSNAVGVGWFELYDIDLVRGRSFSEADGAMAPRVAIVNRAWVDRWIPGTDPLGLRVRLGPADSAEEVRIVGVVETLPMGLSSPEADGRLYTPLAQAPPGPVQIQLRHPDDPLGVVPELRRIVSEIDPDLALGGAMTLRQGHEFMTRAQRVLSSLAAGGGYAGLLVAAVGLYGLLAFRVRRRRRELGVRLAMGADGSRLGLEVLAYALRQVVPAMTVGLGIAWLVAPAMAAILLGNDARALTTYGAVALLFLGVALLSALRPALTASRVQPADVLRSE